MYYRLLLGSMFMAVSLLSCGSGEGKKNPDPNEGSKKIEKTTVSYKINLDDSKKTKEENGKIYYKVPANTEVIIEANLQGPEVVQISWDSTMSGGAYTGTGMPGGNQKNKWIGKSETPITIEVTGKSNTKQENGVDIIVNEKKTFVITWGV